MLKNLILLFILPIILIYYVAELLYISKCITCIVLLPFSLGVCEALFFVKLLWNIMHREKHYANESK